MIINKQNVTTIIISANITDLWNAEVKDVEGDWKVDTASDVDRIPYVHYDRNLKEGELFFIVNADDGHILLWPRGIAAELYYKVLNLEISFKDLDIQRFSFKDVDPRVLYINLPISDNDSMDLSIDENGYIKNWEQFANNCDNFLFTRQR